ncbi:MAG: hypothetical protein P8M03_03115 [Flavobacteriaceae bacterium]|nr:hypothetical protein [Flavobacteriaceae bacterium]
MHKSKNSFEILERNLVLLLNRLKDNHYSIKDLTNKIEEVESVNENLLKINSKYKDENLTLKSANSLLGSKEENKIIRNKVNDLIKEVNQCIDLISTID